MIKKFFKKTIKNKTALIICAAFVLLIPAAALFSLLTPDNAASAESVPVYFINPATGLFEAEERAFPEGLGGNELLGGVLSELAAGPKNKYLSRTTPRGAEFVFEPPDEDGGYAPVSLFTVDGEFTLKERLTLEGSIVWSVTGLDFIGGIMFSLNGSEPVALDRTNMNIMPMLEVARTEHITATLYFSDSTGRYLVPELRHMDVDPNKPQAGYILEQLTAGPARQGSVSAIPPETKIRNVTV